MKMSEINAEKDSSVYRVTYEIRLLASNTTEKCDEKCCKTEANFV